MRCEPRQVRKEAAVTVYPGCPVSLKEGCVQIEHTLFYFLKMNLISQISMCIASCASLLSPAGPCYFQLAGRAAQEIPLS